MSSQNFFEISVDHLTGNDIRLIDSGEEHSPLEVTYLSVGWQIAIPDKEKLQGWVACIRAFGFSSSFIEAILIATHSDTKTIVINVNDSDLCIRENCCRHISQSEDTNDFISSLLQKSSKRMHGLRALKCHNFYTINKIEIDEESFLDLIMDLFEYSDHRKWNTRTLFVEAFEYHHMSKD